MAQGRRSLEGNWVQEAAEELRGRMGARVRDAAEMREQGRPDREPPGTGAATRAGRELSLPRDSGSWRRQGGKGNGGAQPGAGGGSQGFAVRGGGTRALSVPLWVTQPWGIPGSVCLAFPGVGCSCYELVAASPGCGSLTAMLLWRRSWRSIQKEQKLLPGFLGFLKKSPCSHSLNLALNSLL